MIRSAKALAAATLIVTTACSAAGPQAPQVPPKVVEAVQQRLPGVEAERIRPTPLPGIYEVSKGAMVVYVSADGRYLLQGDLIDMDSGEQLTERRRQALRHELVASLGPDMTIDFLPPPEYAHRYTITVFTDIDCGYCRRMHNQMAGYHREGIGIRYLFFPRSGPGTPSFAKAEKVWCSEDRRAALTRAKQGQKVDAPRCDTPVLRHYQLAQELGARGTPFVILPDGDVLNGYLPPDALAVRLAAKAGPDSAAR